MRRRIILGVALAATAVLGTIPALAATSQPSVVATTPVSYTPNVMDGTVYAIAVVGNTVIVGGDFTTVENSARTTTYKKTNLFTYNYTTGVVNTSFTAALDGAVLSLAPGPDNTVYVGGAFKMVGTVHQRGITRLSVPTGARIKGFDAVIGDGEVRAVKYSAGGRLYIGGNFATVDKVSRPALALVGGTSGKVDTKFNLNLTSPTAGRTKVEDMSLAPDGKTLVAIGAIQHAGGQSRAQVVMVNTTTTTATVANWYTNFYDVNCYSSFETYVRGVDFSPEGRLLRDRHHGPQHRQRCALRLRRAVRHRRHRPAQPGLGQLHRGQHAAVGGGHRFGRLRRWSPAVAGQSAGQEERRPGAVPRPGIGAIDPTSGKALSWNPTSGRGVGVEALTATSTGLLVGDDTTELGKKYHARLGMFPLN